MTTPNDLIGLADQPQSSAVANPDKPQLPQHWGFTRKAFPLRYSLWLNDHIEWFEYLTYDEGNYLAGQMTIVYESLSSLKVMLIKVAL